MEGQNIEMEEDEDYPEGPSENFDDSGSYGNPGEDSDENYDDADWEAEVGGSEPVPLGGIYGLFKDVLKKPDSKKVSNLKDDELGNWSLTVRDCERIALIAETFHHPGVAKFFRNQSRIVTDTAMSRRGWFSELFITSKKYASRDSSSSIANLPQFSKKTRSKWRIFSKEPNQETQ